MNKEWFEKQVEEIEVPKEDVLASIHKGMEQGKKDKKSHKWKTKQKILPIVSSSVASLFLISGFIFSPMANVMADVPILGYIYENFSFEVGKELSNQDLVTKLNETSTSNGIDVTLTSAYYDGNVIGVTFKAKGGDITLEQIDQAGPISGYSYFMFDNDDSKGWSSSMEVLKKTDDGFVGAMELMSPNEKLPDHVTLPLTFTSIAGIAGTWKFDVPIEQLPYEKISLHKGSGTADQLYSFNLESVIKGKATTLLNVKTTSPTGDDFFDFRVVDDRGKELTSSRGNVISSKKRDGEVEKKERLLFNDKINENSHFIMVYPEVNRDEQPTIQAIEGTTPFVIESKRFGYQLVINHVKKWKSVNS